MTIRTRVLRYLSVSRGPHLTATYIAKALHEKPATVSSVLYRLYKRGQVKRLSLGGRWSLRYRGGLVYYR
jgi:DNA-binding IclR family transcriptional regulator